MAIMEKMGLDGGMTREQIQQQLFQTRKKLISRQNAADVKKRTEAELLNAQVSELEEVINQTPEDFPDIQLVVQTFAYAADAGVWDGGFKENLTEAIHQNWLAWEVLADSLYRAGQQMGLWTGWVFMAAQCGYSGAFENCGYCLGMQGRWEEAFTWYEKAEACGRLSPVGMFNWGTFCIAVKGNEAALEKYQAAVDRGMVLQKGHLHNWGQCSRAVGDYGTALAMFRKSLEGGECFMALMPLGEMYENGEGVARDLQEALRLFEEAEKHGEGEARQAADRVRNKIEEMRKASPSAAGMQSQPKPKASGNAAGTRQKTPVTRLPQGGVPAGQGGNPVPQGGPPGGKDGNSVPQGGASNGKNGNPVSRGGASAGQNGNPVFQGSAPDPAPKKPTVSGVDDVKLNELGPKKPGGAGKGAAQGLEALLKDRKKLLIIAAAVVILVVYVLPGIFARLYLNREEDKEKILEESLEESLVESAEESGTDTDLSGESEGILAEDTDATPAGSFTYEIYGDEVHIKAFTGSETEIVVPSVIEGKPVVRICANAFREQKKITSVTLKPGIIAVESSAFADCDALGTLVIRGTDLVIEDVAFRNCKSLQTVELSGVTGIGTGAFAECISLQQIIIPEGTICIGREAFKGCGALKEAQIPSTVTVIEDGAFYGAKSLETVTFTPGAEGTSIGTNCFRECGSLKEISVNAEYGYIGDGAFMDCTALQRVTVSGTGITVGDNAFLNCKSLQTVELNDAAGIGTGAFRGCISLAQIGIPEGAAYIGTEAFGSCDSLQEVVIPSTMTSLGDNAFREDKKLTHVTFTPGDQDASIGSGCFRACSSLEEVSIPGNYTLIGENAFLECVSLKSLNWERGNVSYANQVIGGWAFNGCSSLQQITLSDSLSGIQDGAFSQCISLASADIPENVTYVGNKAFEGCTSLASVSLPSTIETLGDSAFRGDYALTEVSFAAGTMDASIQDSCFRDCTSLTQMAIPENYVWIGSSSFEGCTSLAFTVWNASGAVYENQSMGDGVFAGCSNLTEVHLSGNVGQIGGNAFKECPNLTVYAPEGSAAALYASENQIPFLPE